MIIAELTGGMGNQMFQYAAAKALSLHHHTELLLDVHSFYREVLPELEVPRNFDLTNFSGVHETLITPYHPLHNYKAYKKTPFSALIAPHKRKVYKEPFYHYDKNFLKARKDVMLKGGWQSEHYFALYKNEIRQAFAIKDEVIKRVKEISEKMKRENSVAVHIRRGDYLRLPIILAWHGVLDANHYNHAFAALKSKNDKPLSIYYFTDDPAWVQENLCRVWPGTIASKEYQTNGIEDFYLMSQCNHNIIANSSFSWWAAWLNNHPGKIVVAPIHWFGNAPFDTKDLYPETWMKV